MIFYVVTSHLDTDMHSRYVNTTGTALIVSFLTLTSACDCIQLGDDLVCGSDTLDSATAGEPEPEPLLGCELTLGGLNPDTGGWVYPWLALYWSAECTPDDLESVEISINGAPAYRPKLLQIGSEYEPNCAIYIFDGDAGGGLPWTFDWSGTDSTQGAGHIDVSEVTDWFPVWSIFAHTDPALVSAPRYYGPQCSVPLDWYLDPQPWSW